MKAIVPKLQTSSDGRAFVWVPRSKPRRKVYFGPADQPESQQRYRWWCQQWLAEQVATTPEPIRPQTTTLAEVALRWLRHLDQSQRPTASGRDGRQSVQSSIRKLMAAHAGTPAAVFTPKVAKAWLVSLARDGVSRSMLQKHWLRVRQMLRWAESEELIPAGTWAALAVVAVPRSTPSLPIRETKPQPSLSIDTLRQTLLVLGTLFGDIVRVTLYCGMRPGETLSMRIEEIDRSDDSLWTFTPALHKNEWRGQSRTIAIPPAAIEIIRATIGDRVDGYVWPSPRKHCAGQRMRTTTLCTAIYRACQRAGLPRWSPNQLRHLSATLLKQSLGWQAAQAWLGHQSPDTTAIYAETTARELATVAASISQLMADVLPGSDPASPGTAQSSPPADDDLQT